MASGVKVSKMNFELNPRGNLWFNDESTFGHKLLAKMGWSKGKGLGKNEDGIKENIKISKKDSNSGVGWKNDTIPVAVGCLEYENILQNLQKHFKNNHEMSDTSKRYEKSLEQRSRSARHHLHYQKFVRVKDLNRYSEKDMKSIFLEKPLKPVSEHPSRPPQTPTFNSQLSVNDYFAQKMQKKKEEISKSVSDVSTEVNLRAQLQPSDHNFSKKRKFLSESPQIPQKAKTRKRKTGDEMSVDDDKLTEKSSELEESCQKKKKKKNKLRLQQLKSCIKDRANYNLEKTKNVSFNEQVSYKILDTSLELREEMNDEERTDEELPTLVDSDEESHNEVSSSETNVSNEEEEEERPQCFDLPKCSGTNFNFWLESQRQASKMKLYKEMARKIKKNKILRSTNLLDIKGYGNWGL